MLKRNQMPQLDLETRKTCFDEVNKGYSKHLAISEANRCLSCTNAPCMNACPLHNNIPLFISYIKNDDIDMAYKTISLTSPLSSICSRVCPHEKQCEGACNLNKVNEGICIGGLERFVSDNSEYKVESSICFNEKVAVIGSGPSGLSCAYFLAREGYKVTVFEIKRVIGGVLKYGIPNFRLPKSVVDKEIDKLKRLNVEFVCDKKIDNVSDLFKQGFNAVYVAVGANKPMMMHINGENKQGVYTAYEFLEKVNLCDDVDFKDKKVVVVGGGNVAMDTARSLVRLGCKKVEIVYRRSLQELPAYKSELMECQNEGVVLTLLTNPIEILGDDCISKVRCIKMELGQPDESGRRKPVEIKGSEFEIDCDALVMAIGNTADSCICDVETNEKGYIVVDDNLESSVDMVYAGGDAVTGPYTVANACLMGRNAANNIIEHFQKQQKQL